MVVVVPADGGERIRPVSGRGLGGRDENQSRDHGVHFHAVVRLIARVLCLLRAVHGVTNRVLVHHQHNGPVLDGAVPQSRGKTAATLHTHKQREKVRHTTAHTGRTHRQRPHGLQTHELGCLLGRNLVLRLYTAYGLTRGEGGWYPEQLPGAGDGLLFHPDESGLEGWLVYSA